MRKYSLYAILICPFFFSCAQGEKTELTRNVVMAKDSFVFSESDTESHENKESLKPIPPADYDTLLWTEISRIQADILLDLRYASTNNFLEVQLYDCPRCFLRPEIAKALQKVQLELQSKGLGILIWDCYRPQSVQRKMWEAMPNPNYVANPERGSMHSRGIAVDATIVDEEGVPLDMGTDFDHFGKEAHYDNRGLPEEILFNRDLLRSVMEKYGLIGIRTEWWHFSMRNVSYPLDEMVWQCE